MSQTTVETGKITVAPARPIDVIAAQLAADAGKGSELAHLVMDLHNRDHAMPAFYCHQACQEAERSIVHGE